MAEEVVLGGPGRKETTLGLVQGDGLYVALAELLGGIVKNTLADFRVLDPDNVPQVDIPIDFRAIGHQIEGNRNIDGNFPQAGRGVNLKA